MQIDIEERPRKRLALVHHVGPFNEIGGAFKRLGDIAGPAGLFKAGVEMIGVFHDNPRVTPPKQLRSDAAVTIDDEATLPEGLEEGGIPAGRYAHVRHVGPYSTLGETWGPFVSEWIPGSGHRVGRGPTFEIYRGPMTNKPPITDLYVPVE